MPTLDWPHRAAAFTAAAQVPYRLMDTVATHGDPLHAVDKPLIQGDNLEALKELLPFYQGQAHNIPSHVGELRDTAAQWQFRQCVLEQGGPNAWLVEADWAHPHVFTPSRYPAPVASRYSGRYQFAKHYFPVLAELKDGGEELLCAQQIDKHPQVKHCSGARAVFGGLTKQRDGKSLAQQLDAALA